MTDKSIPTLIEEEEATEAGAQGLAAADLAAQVMRILEQALDASGIDQKTLAEKLGVTQGRVSQVLNGDGNLRVAAVARYLRALGYETHLSATPVDTGKPSLPRASRRRSMPTQQQTIVETRYVARLRKHVSEKTTS
ncbi:Cro/C1-type helix-turn-helix domain [Mycobacteriaceae bacterium]